jgi:hypothetical protein
MHAHMHTRLADQGSECPGKGRQPRELVPSTTQAGPRPGGTCASTRGRLAPSTRWGPNPHGWEEAQGTLPDLPGPSGLGAVVPDHHPLNLPDRVTATAPLTGPVQESRPRTMGREPTVPEHAPSACAQPKHRTQSPLPLLSCLVRPTTPTQVATLREGRKTRQTRTDSPFIGHTPHTARPPEGKPTRKQHKTEEGTALTARTQHHRTGKNFPLGRRVRGPLAPVRLTARPESD